jgi:hypothetical protein
LKIILPDLEHRQPFAAQKCRITRDPHLAGGPSSPSASVTTSAGPTSSASAAGFFNPRFSINTFVSAKTVLPPPPTSTLTGMNGNNAIAQARPKNS